MPSDAGAPIRVQVLYFAAARERAGVSSETLTVPAGSTAGAVRAAACAAHPALAPIASRIRLAVNEEFVDDAHPVPDRAEVALIPPVAGGSGRHVVSAEPLAPGAPLAAVAGTDCGATVTFIGTVRDQNRGAQVVSLEYEAYPSMALRIFAGIEERARARWPGCRLSIHHRVGALAPGDVSVVIAAAAPHRGDAFEACRMAIEELKEHAPVWKREQYPDGSHWVDLGS